MRAYFCFLLLALGLAACAPQTRYDWGDYSSSLRDYYIDPAAEPNYDKTLVAVTAGTDGRKVAPGLYAESGYEALSHGDVDQAVTLFEREKAAWPESAVFMDKAIAAARSGKKPGPADTKPPADHQAGS